MARAMTTSRRSTGAVRAVSGRRSTGRKSNGSGGEDEEHQLEEMIARAQAEARAELERGGGGEDSTPRRASRRSLPSRKPSKTLKGAETEEDDEEEDEDEDEEDQEFKGKVKKRGGQNGKPKVSGFGRAVAAGRQEMQENVFLFVPNLIGECPANKFGELLRPDLHISMLHRLLSHHSRCALLILHGGQPQELHCALLHLVPSRRLRWHGSQSA